METTNIDKFKQQHKGKYIKTGLCVYPFNLKKNKKDIRECIKGKTGDWCPTSLTPNGYTNTWAYCKHPNKTNSSKTKSKKNATLPKSHNSKKGKLKSEIPKTKNAKTSLKINSRINNSYTINRRLGILRNIIPKINLTACDNIDSILTYLDEDGTIKSGIKMIGQGSSGVVFSSCLDKGCIDNLVIKFIKITNDFEYNQNDHPIKVEIKFLKLFSSKLIETKITPHLLLYYADFDCNLSTFLRLKNVNSRIKEKLKQDEQSGGILNKLKVLFIEHTQTDLHNLITTRKLSENEFLVILFQLFYTMIVIQYYFPNFRHNDLKPDNILVRTYPIIKDHYYTYKIFGNSYHIPDIGIKLKIWDFDFASCNDVKNSKIESFWSNTFGATSKINPIYDIHTFMNMSLIHLRKHIPSSIVEIYEINLTTEDETLIMASSSRQKNIKLIGQKTQFTQYGRLTGHKRRHKGILTNIIPNDMYSFGDYLLDEDKPLNYFLEKNPQYNYQNGTLISEYDSKIPNNLDTRKRSDIFNIFEE